MISTYDLSADLQAMMREMWLHLRFKICSAWSHLCSMVETFTPEMSVADRKREVFMMIMKEYNPLISKLAYSYSRSRSDYDDLCQDIQLNIWKGLQTFRNESEMSTWVYRVSLNTCVSTIRSQRRNTLNKGENSLLATLSDTGEDAENMERIEELHHLISKLGPEDKAIINLWLADKSYEEISAVMGMKRNTVATRLRRIKEKLSQWMLNDE